MASLRPSSSTESINSAMQALVVRSIGQPSRLLNRSDGGLRAGFRVSKVGREDAWLESSVLKGHDRVMRVNEGFRYILEVFNRLKTDSHGIHDHNYLHVFPREEIAAYPFGA